MAVVTREQVAAELYRLGVRGETLALMTGIPQRESGYRTDAHRSDQPKSKLSGDRGLFQINYIWDKQLKAAGIINSAADLFDPIKNIRAAVYVMNKQGPAAWGAGSGGWQTGGKATYGVDMNAARMAAAYVEINKGKVPSGQKALSGASGGGSGTVSKASVPKGGADPKRTGGAVKYTPPKVNPAQQKAMTNLLSGFGIKYPNAPRATPALLAYLRGVGLSTDLAKDQFRETKAEIDRQAADSMGDLRVADQRRRVGIANNAASRGALVSGATNTDYAEQAEDLARSQADIKRRQAEAIGAASRGRDTFMDSTRQQALERVIGEEQRQDTQEATSKAEVAAINRAQRESDLAYARQKNMQQEALKAQVALYNSR